MSLRSYSFGNLGVVVRGHGVNDHARGEHGGEPSSRQVYELLDERLAHRGRAGEDAAVAASSGA
jgi:hypothetical protein